MNEKSRKVSKRLGYPFVYLFSSHGYDVYGDAGDPEIATDGKNIPLTGCLRYYLDGKGEFRAVSLMTYDWLWEELNKLYPPEEDEDDNE